MSSTLQPKTVSPEDKKLWIKKGAKITLAKPVSFALIGVLMIFALTNKYLALMLYAGMPLIASVYFIVAYCASENYNSLRTLLTAPRNKWIDIYKPYIAPFIIFLISYLLLNFPEFSKSDLNELEALSFQVELLFTNFQLHLYSVFISYLLPVSFIPLILFKNIDPHMSRELTRQAATKNPELRHIGAKIFGFGLPISVIVPFSFVLTFSIYICTLYVAYRDIWDDGAKKTTQEKVTAKLKPIADVS